MTPLQSPASLQAQIKECIVQSQRTTEWSQEMIALSNEKMRKTKALIRRGIDRKKLCKPPAEVPVSLGSRFLQLSHS
ncbi:MAG TPA: hypothetical protein VFB76_05480 [Candidatus Angelobacter sp.]|nr:hypothetical protein [Candidatus Angelobacter sp.]